MAAQLRNFLDLTGGGLWAQGALIGKVGSVFVSTARQHGGQETTITSTIAGSDGQRSPSPKELRLARGQGQCVAEIAGKLAAR